jgi:Zn-dependent M16 (insulinase) family peptidase
VAHILEHSVLCGSRKYKSKEPFVDLLKGSVNTFLNAFTYPDRTCYPVASQNSKDFYNLVDVYMDAVLHPRAMQDPQVLQQEGWHYELEKQSDPLTYKGVVFNEMKGEGERERKCTCTHNNSHHDTRTHARLSCTSHRSQGCIPPATRCWERPRRRRSSPTTPTA